MDLISVTRPEDLDQFVGQEHLFGKNGVLRKYLKSGFLPSSILYGPPGCGKTSTFYVLKKYLKGFEIHRLDVPSTNLNLIRKILERARRTWRYGTKTLLFLEDIHHLNRKDQRIFLEPVENGYLVLVGTTTENPQRYVINPLLSRLRIFKFRKLEPEHVEIILKRAVEKNNLSIDEEMIKDIAVVSDGDARFALLSLQDVIEGGGILPKNVFGKKEHYDLISAFIKSIRGSDPDAAVYYLARLLELGEDPRFIARRLIILASEDIGLADSKALQIAVSAAQAVEYVGMPEAEINLAHATLYLALAPKSNSAYEALKRAKEIALNPVEVPKHLRNISESGYLYPHDFGGYVEQRYLPENVSEKLYIQRDLGEEGELGKWRRGKIRSDQPNER